MTCPTCGEESPESNPYCRHCGSPLVAASRSATQARTTDTTTPVPGPPRASASAPRQVGAATAEVDAPSEGPSATHAHVDDDRATVGPRCPECRAALLRASSSARNVVPADPARERFETRSPWAQKRRPRARLQLRAPPQRPCRKDPRLAAGRAPPRQGHPRRLCLAPQVGVWRKASARCSCRPSRSGSSGARGKLGGSAPRYRRRTSRSSSKRR